MEGLEDVLGVLTGLMTVVLSLGVAFWAIYWSHQKRRLQFQERQLLIERGITPSADLPTEPRRKLTPEDCLRRGTILLFLGIGLSIGYFALPYEALAAFALVTGAIVGFLGLGHLVYYFIARHDVREITDNTGVMM